MFRMFRYFLWVVVVLAMILSFDQLMLSWPMTISGLRETQQFYIDFRQRLGNLAEGGASKSPGKPAASPAKPRTAGDSIASVITREASPEKVEKNSRYLYVDRNGTLQFADSLKQVPARYRDSAQRLAE